MGQSCEPRRSFIKNGSKTQEYIVDISRSQFEERGLKIVNTQMDSLKARVEDENNAEHI